MRKLIYAVMAATLLSACQGQNGDNGATGATGPQGPQGPQGPAAPIAQPTAIQQIVDAENAYRATLGQPPLTLGLSCTVQAIASGTFLWSGSPGYTAAQAIVTTGTQFQFLLSTAINQPNRGPGPDVLLPVALQPLFLTNNYRVICTGQLVVTEDGYHSFSVASDDGAVLFIDGTAVTDNDGAHGVSTVTGTKLLEAAVTHSFQIQYAQSAGGQFALVVNMDGKLLPAANLYH